ncbi:hypothetical protein [Desulfosporosinus sp. FKA]|uniref:hypothetical protein n=1 Tax=Desulfosporosinus sp. FKA TaxID=1969834 RepID=UPI00112508D9|nr:hypothetical protein [Desulfosporosinus sp. FKA]
MTQPSVLRSQSKLAVQATGFGERGSRHKRRPWRYGGSEHPCSLPRIWGRSLSRSLLTAYVKTPGCCHTASLVWGRGNGCLGDGT